MKFLTSLDLVKNELQNAVIQPLAVAPSNPKEGQIYYNSTDKYIYRFDGTNWAPIGVVYQQGSTTGAVVTGLDASGNVTTTNVVGLTLAGYTPIEDGYVSANMSLEDAFKALDTAVKNAVAGGGEINQNAWSNINVKKQSTATTAVDGQAADATISATTKTDTFSVASGNKWVDINSDDKQINIGHSLSGVTAGTYGDTAKVAKVAVDAAGHVTSAEEVAITPAAIGADVAGAAADVLGTDADDSSKNTVYGAKKAAAEAKAAADAAQTAADGKVASVGATANGGIEISGTDTDPTVGIKLDPKDGNAASLSAAGLLVTIPDAAEYTIVKLGTATEGYIATYQLQKDGVQVGANIDIPKDYLVKSADIKVSAGDGDPSGFPAGTKYIDFVINTKVGVGEESHIYLSVQELVDTYTAGNGIVINGTNEISVKVVAANGLSVDKDGIKIALASADTNGAMSNDQYTKLEGIEAGATNNEITLNGTVTKKPSFYAPTTAGENGQVLVSSGTGAPTWQAMPEHYHKYTTTNAAITAVGGAFTWSIPAATHGVSNAAMIVQLYEVASNQLVIADVAVNATNYNVTITINDTNSAGTLTAGTYKVVIFG